MKISIDDGGNVSLDTSYDSTNINTTSQTIKTIHKTLSEFDNEKLPTIQKNTSDSLQNTDIMTELSDEWEVVKEEVDE